MKKAEKQKLYTAKEVDDIIARKIAIERRKLNKKPDTVVSSLSVSNSIFSERLATAYEESLQTIP